MLKIMFILLLTFASTGYADTTKCQKTAEFAARNLFFINEYNSQADMKVKQKHNNWSRTSSKTHETYKIEFQDEGGYRIAEPYVVDVLPHGHGDCRVVGFKTE